MSGLGIRLYTDEDVNPHLAVQLQRLGYDALSCHAAGNANQGFSDDWQLTYAVEQQRSILIFNLRDYYDLDRRWRQRGQQHHGIITVHAEIAFSELFRRTILHLNTHSAEEQYDTLLFLAR